MKRLGSKGGDWNLKYSIAIGTFGAGAALMTIGLLGFSNLLNVYDIIDIHRYLIFILMAINGIA
jgi:hypothetical protein